MANFEAFLSIKVERKPLISEEYVKKNILLIFDKTCPIIIDKGPMCTMMQQVFFI